MNAPVTVSGATKPRGFWTPEKIVERIQRWVTLYGETPRSADWNPSAAKWSAAEWRIERYRLGDPETGEPWPPLNAAKRHFGGSLNAALAAAGFEPNKSGPKRRRDVHPAMLDRLPIPSDVRIALEAARAEARDLAETVEVRDRQLDKLRSARDRFREERDTARRTARARVERKVTKTKTKTVVREDHKAISRARAKVRHEESEKARAKLNDLKVDLAAARRDATKMASRLERAEATINTLRADRRELKRDLTRAEDAVTRAQDRGVALERLAKTRPEPEVKEVVRVERKVVEVEPASVVEVREARELSAEAERLITEAETRVARAERKYAEIAEAAVGERRVLTPAEMAELRKGGPGGEPVLTEAIRALMVARKRGSRTDLKQALVNVASAAVRWRDRL